MNKIAAFARLPVLASLLLSSACGEPPVADEEALPATPKVLVFGIDGVRPDVLAEVATPNIDALVQEGWYSAEVLTATPSYSGPSWSSMLTGVWPDKHGVTNNDFTDRNYAQYPSFLARIETVRPELGTFAALTWLPLAVLDDGDPLLPATIDALVPLNGDDFGWGEADDTVAAQAVEHLGAADPDALFIYFGNPDWTSHDIESIGPEYREAIALADSQLGMVMEAVRARPSYGDEDWLILVSTDHGRRPDGGHGGDSPEEMTIFIAASGPATADWPEPGPAEIVDVGVTALDHLGLELDPSWELDGRPLGAPAL